MKTLLDPRWEQWLTQLAGPPIDKLPFFGTSRASANTVNGYLSTTDVFDKFEHGDLAKAALKEITFGDLSWGFTALVLRKESSLEKLQAVDGGNVKVGKHLYPHRFVMAGLLCAIAFSEDPKPIANRLHIAQARRAMHVGVRVLAHALLAQLPRIRKELNA